MDNFDDLSVHFIINSALIFLFQLAIIGSSILIITKYRKSIGAKIMLVGTVFTLISIILFQVVPYLTGSFETDNYLKVQVLLSYLNTFSFLVFTTGFVIFAINDLKKEQNKT
ncbi:hypothetical protein [Winogradskyella sp.]|uniref:hypothetical protein n=1 Tax=Winogradskyella sp. TaxID=1883156 RepID=UPI003F6B9EDB